jgi:hypothetical protein
MCSVGSDGWLVVILTCLLLANTLTNNIKREKEGQLGDEKMTKEIHCLKISLSCGIYAV